ncbi:hypothetical protein [Bacillus chungangensis]|uniref:Integrase n=1 Tax=Bacillus chungangensis TaxID=587633 RepID=A0ABT9WPM2_9BACI|nr:hypothetical protein [Bacillus chungangensis]MDQ0175240.1 hypothetical protein [Bacillus chungangensis]
MSPTLQSHPKKQHRIDKNRNETDCKKPALNRVPLSEAEIKNLMGINRPTYRRYRGAFRQR